MKYILSCLALYLVMTSTTFGQDNEEDQPHKITFMFGWNFSKYTTTDESGSTKFKSGAIVGINKDVKLFPFLWTNGGLLYYQNGADTDAGTFKLNYLMLPAGLKLKFGPVYGMLGLYGAYRLTAKLGDEKIDKKEFNRLDFGTYLGVGVKFLKLFTLNFKYNWGASDVSNGTNDSQNYDLRNRFYSFTLGIGIP